MQKQRMSKITIVVVAALALVAACNAAASPTPAPTSSPSPGRAEFSGIFSCTGAGLNTTDCTLRASDERASGTEHIALSTAELPDGSTRVWSTSPFTHKSAAGSWECTNVGTISPNGLHLYEGICLGKDAFDNQVMYLHAAGLDGSTFYVTGWIEPAA